MTVAKSSAPYVRYNWSHFKYLETFRFEDDYEYEIWLKVLSRILKIWTPQKASFYHFSLEKLALLPLVKEVTPSPDRRMIKLLTFDLITCFRLVVEDDDGYQVFPPKWR